MIALALAVAAAITWAVSSIWDHGYTAGADSQKARYESAHVDQLEENQSLIAAAILQAKTDAKAQLKKELVQLENERQFNATIEATQNEISHAVFLCNDIGPDFLRLFNQPIRSANCAGKLCGDPGELETRDSGSVASKN